MKISIAMAAYNGGRFIAEQLESFAGQSRLPDELVICDDGSTDDTMAIVERFAAGAAFPVRLYRNPENLGFNHNFARALSLCEGDLLLISDQDDVWYPSKIEQVERAISDEPGALVIVHDEHLADAEGNVLPGTFMRNVRKLGYPDRYFVAGNCTATRRELLPLLLPPVEGENYDGWFALVTDLLGVRRLLEQPLQLYRRHGGNSSEPELARHAPSLLSVAAPFGLKDARRGWAAQIVLLEEARRRIDAERALVDGLAGPGRAEAAIGRIDAETGRLRKRSQLLGLSRWRRIPSVLRLWSNGFYRDFAGAKSAMKDLVRP